MRLDWKFYITLIATLAGVVAPIWLWKVDIQAHSLQLRVVSQASLEPEIPKAVSGLKLSIDGADVEHPFMSVLELTNDGSRPISAADYEDAIQIMVNEEGHLIRAHMTDVQPKDLQPKFSTDNGMLQINPLLLNPADVITFAVITSGGKPSFTVRARIAGIPSVSVEDRAARKNNKAKHFVHFVVAVLQLFVYIACIMVLVFSRRFVLSKLTTVVGGISTGIGSAILIAPLRDNLSLSTMQFYGGTAVIFIIAYVAALGLGLNRRQPREF